MAFTDALFNHASAIDERGGHLQRIHNGKPGCSISRAPDLRELCEPSRPLLQRAIGTFGRPTSDPRPDPTFSQEGYDLRDKRSEDLSPSRHGLPSLRPSGISQLSGTAPRSLTTLADQHAFRASSPSPRPIRSSRTFRSRAPKGTQDPRAWKHHPSSESRPSTLPTPRTMRISDSQESAPSSPETLPSFEP